MIEISYCIPKEDEFAYLYISDITMECIQIIKTFLEVHIGAVFDVEYQNGDLVCFSCTPYNSVCVKNDNFIVIEYNDDMDKYIPVVYTFDEFDDLYKKKVS